MTGSTTYHLLKELRHQKCHETGLFHYYVMEFLVLKKTEESMYLGDHPFLYTGASALFWKAFCPLQDPCLLSGDTTLSHP